MTKDEKNRINDDKIQMFLMLASCDRKYLVEKFWAKVHKTESCWLWIGPKNAQGYGQMSIRVDGRPLCFRAHRLAWALLRGICSLPFDHLCKNKSCINPDHLEPVTTAENNYRLRKTHCKRGHEFTPDNTRITLRGRACKLCAWLATREFAKANPGSSNAARNRKRGWNVNYKPKRS